MATKSSFIVKNLEKDKVFQKFKVSALSGLERIWTNKEILQGIQKQDHQQPTPIAGLTINTLFF